MILVPVICLWVAVGVACAVVLGRALRHADAVQRPAPFVPVEPEALPETDPRYEQIALFDPLEAQPVVVTAR